MLIFVLSIIAYLLGTFPSGRIFAKIFKLGNLEKIGSGNVGATNVLRTGNKWAAFFTLIFDALKGTLAVLLPYAIVTPKIREIVKKSYQFYLVGGPLLGMFIPFGLNLKAAKELLLIWVFYLALILFLGL